MKLNTILSLFLSTTLLVSCGLGGNSGGSEVASVMNEISAVLEEVKDADGAKQARAELEPLTGRLAKLTADMAEKATDKPVQMDEKAAKTMAEATTRYSEALTRVFSDPALSEHLGDVLTP